MVSNAGFDDVDHRDCGFRNFSGGWIYSSTGFGSSGQGFAQAFAAGALLTMLCDTMLPEAYEEERVFTGALVVLGFAGSLLLAAF